MELQDCNTAQQKIGLPSSVRECSFSKESVKNCGYGTAAEHGKWKKVLVVMAEAEGLSHWSIKV
jgi:hypothetical protein